MTNEQLEQALANKKLFDENSFDSIESLQNAKDMKQPLPKVAAPKKIQRLGARLNEPCSNLESYQLQQLEPILTFN